MLLLPTLGYAMFGKLVTFSIPFFFTAACAAVDVNQASEAELDGIRGIGPPTSRLIIAEREKSEFRDWDDFMARVKGAGPKNAARFSADGLTVAGQPYRPGTRNEPKQEKKDNRPVASPSAASSAGR